MCTEHLSQHVCSTLSGRASARQGRGLNLQHRCSDSFNPRQHQYFVIILECSIFVHVLQIRRGRAIAWQITTSYPQILQPVAVIRKATRFVQHTKGFTPRRPQQPHLEEVVAGEDGGRDEAPDDAGSVALHQLVADAHRHERLVDAPFKCRSRAAAVAAAHRLDCIWLLQSPLACASARRPAVACKAPKIITGRMHVWHACGPCTLPLPKMQMSLHLRSGSDLVDQLVSSRGCRDSVQAHRPMGAELLTWPDLGHGTMSSHACTTALQWHKQMYSIALLVPLWPRPHACPPHLRAHPPAPPSALPPSSEPPQTQSATHPPGTFCTPL